MPIQVLFHAPAPLVELLRIAASQQEVSRAAFIRAAIKEKAGRVLSGIEAAPAESAGRGPMTILADQSGGVLGLRGTQSKSMKKSE